MKSFTWTIVILLPLFGLAQQSGFIINGEVKGLSEHSRVFLTDANNPTDTIAEALVEMKEDPRFTAKTILFALRSDRLDQGFQASLADLAGGLVAHPEWQLAIEGYTDITGKPERNLFLSQQRAQAVKTWLIKKGVPEQQLIAKGYGEQRPIADNATEAGRSANRRVEFKLVTGQFVLSGHIAEPNIYEVNFGSAQKKTAVFIGNEKIKLTGDVEDLKSITATGSSLNDDFMSFQKIFNPYFAHLNEVGKLANSPAGTGRQDSLARVYKRLVDSIETSLGRFIADRPSSTVSAFAMVVLARLSDDVMLEEKRFNSLSPDVQAGFYGKYLQGQLSTAKIGAVGTEAIEFTQNDTAGHAVSLSSYRGKYVLVDFWASWCGPCRQENPNVVSTYSKFKDKNFTVLGVSLDRARDPWIKAINDDHLVWTQVSDLQFWNNAAAQKYHLNQIPTNLLVDPNGKIVGRDLRGQELQNKLCELLGCN